jgi:hypothetical protein
MYLLGEGPLATRLFFAGALLRSFQKPDSGGYGAYRLQGKSQAVGFKSGGVGSGS